MLAIVLQAVIATVVCVVVWKYKKRGPPIEHERNPPAYNEIATSSSIYREYDHEKPNDYDLDMKSNSDSICGDIKTNQECV